MTSFFTPEEFRCRCGRTDCDAPSMIQPALLTLLNQIREQLARPVLITSGLRCAKYNALPQIGGEKESAHLTGHAADIACASGTDRFATVRAALAVGARRVGVGTTFVHIDVASLTHAQDVLWLYPVRSA